jgi:hypothetical protein
MTVRVDPTVNIPELFTSDLPTLSRTANSDLPQGKVADIHPDRYDARFRAFAVGAVAVVGFRSVTWSLVVF